MKDLLLEKLNLPPGFIDLSIGEATIVKDTLLSLFNANYLIDDFGYQSPAGYKPLVSFLENKYNAPIVICCGAKQALCASFYALKKMGKSSITMRRPYWCLLPQIIELYGLQWNKKDFDSVLIVNPNNPDNFIYDTNSADLLFSRCLERNIPTIHDAVYYNKIYMPDDYPIKQFGNVQLFSFSKYLGLSGLRIGFAVCYDTKFYQKIKEYVEATTVGVSIASQQFIYSLLCDMDKDKDRTSKFESTCKNILTENKKLLKNINPTILEIPDDIEKHPGIFGWFRVMPKCDFNAAKINVVSGKLFGDESRVRFNLGLPTNTMIEVVERLNKL